MAGGGHRNAFYRELAPGIFVSWQDMVARLNVSLTNGERLYLYLRREKLSRDESVAYATERWGLKRPDQLSKWISGEQKAPLVILNDGLAIGEVLFLARYRAGWNRAKMAEIMEIKIGRLLLCEGRMGRAPLRQSNPVDRDCWAMMLFWSKTGVMMVRDERTASPFRLEFLG